MNSKICVSIGEADFAACMEWAAMFPLVEIRLDLMQLDEKKIQQLAGKCRQWVATCRQGKYADGERAAQLTAAIRAGATYVDIEYEAEETYRNPLVEIAKNSGVQVIISYHNFDTTPEIPTLTAIIEQSLNMGADWVKLAVTAHSPADAANIMSLYGQYSRLIAFAMSDAGKISRIAAPFLGAPFTFAAISDIRPTAPGQLSADQMQKIFEIVDS
jgi:3-dehydroquinate dehydratase-1